MKTFIRIISHESVVQKQKGNEELKTIRTNQIGKVDQMTPSNNHCSIVKACCEIYARLRTRENLTKSLGGCVFACIVMKVKMSMRIQKILFRSSLSYQILEDEENI